ncbi:MAG: MarR family transcriptional regulator [Desulfarculus sp.]|jgi:DNA-binding MarR family transcriptional regulator|nr:MAG: MarR family transcriptional regulator [Desulfarculus sp.]
MVIDQQKCLLMARTCACFSLRRASRLVSQAFDRALKPSGLRITQFSVLSAYHMSGDLGISKMSRGLGMDRTTLSRNLKLLAQKGLITLEPAEDRREQRVKVTQKGAQAFEQAVPYWEQAQQKVISTLGDEKWAAMQQDLRALAAGAK